MSKWAASLESSVGASRRARGLTQAHLARAAQVSRQTIVELERGNYNCSTALALRLAVLLDTPVEQLFRLPREEYLTLVQERQDLVPRDRGGGDGSA